jgi:hypothetical protein
MQAATEEIRAGIIGWISGLSECNDWLDSSRIVVVDGSLELCGVPCHVVNARSGRQVRYHISMPW